MKKSMENRYRSSDQLNVLHILCTIATLLTITLMFMEYIGETFIHLQTLSGATIATVILTATVFAYRWCQKAGMCYLFQVVLAGVFGLAGFGESLTRDYRLVTLGVFNLCMIHNVCIDRFLYIMRRIDESLRNTRLIMCAFLSVFSVGGYVCSLAYLPETGITTLQQLESPDSDAPKAIPVTKSMLEQGRDLFLGVYQNAREFEKVNKCDEVCGYPREWIEKLKAFENEPLQSGAIDVSRIREDKLRPKVMEVGYGMTSGEIADAKRYGFLDKDAEWPRSMTKEEADLWMETITIPTYDAMVRDMVKVELTTKQRFALLSFAHNTGGGNLQKLVCYKDRLNSGNFECIPAIIRLYVNAGKHLNVRGLVKRRNWEAELFGDSFSEVAVN